MKSLLEELAGVLAMTFGSAAILAITLYIIYHVALRYAS